MANYRNMELHCGCCGTVFDAKVLRSYYNSSDIGLDLNPHNEAVFDSIVQCPSCGYTSLAIQKPAIVSRSQVAKLLESTTRDYSDSIVQKAVLGALIAEASKDYRTAGLLYLMSYWRTLNGEKEDGRHLLLKATENQELYLVENQDVDTAIVYIDCLRQLEMFDQAAETAIDLSQYVNDAQRLSILEYERKLIERNDCAPHSLSEVSV